MYGIIIIFMSSYGVIIMYKRIIILPCMYITEKYDDNSDEASCLVRCSACCSAISSCCLANRILVSDTSFIAVVIVFFCWPDLAGVLFGELMINYYEFDKKIVKV